jgi:hypothetical protein
MTWIQTKEQKKPKKLIAKRAFCFRGFSAMRNVPMLVQALKLIRCQRLKSGKWKGTKC